MKVLRIVWRVVTFRPCEVCGDRWRCLPWHVEVFDCPTCGRAVDEFDPAFGRVLGEVWEQGT